MKIKLVSDLHLEFSDINITNYEGCDVLILSGDIMVAEDLHNHSEESVSCLLYTSPSPRDKRQSRMPSSA